MQVIIVNRSFQVIQIVVHCIDSRQVKERGMMEIFPALFKYVEFHMHSILGEQCNTFFTGGPIYVSFDRVVLYFSIMSLLFQVQYGQLLFEYASSCRWNQVRTTYHL